MSMYYSFCDPQHFVFESPCARRRRSTCPHSWWMCVAPLTRTRTRRTSTAALSFFLSAPTVLDRLLIHFRCWLSPPTYYMRNQKCVSFWSRNPSPNRIARFSFAVAAAERNRNRSLFIAVRSLSLSLFFLFKRPTHRTANDVQSDVFVIYPSYRASSAVVAFSPSGGFLRFCFSFTGTICCFSAETSAMRRIFFLSAQPKKIAPPRNKK